ncbi:peptidyl-prolyl cis-trans isomerase [Aestuariirhabdus litorea]|uniref:Peptidyl-prolyl cis-trans isomerase n=1 Tax=Aestuariirhabdus litorea TaxID=2528527 RepID=A0A3P3VNR9_9GAMM|nr:peptidylprolyl isomerase [Aestuariirhabdus litorea]RRJ84401.1 peptidyl-prolyl cis-trans isomerase [Aestuariirhabdus litorea]RWW97625.1 peptidyl-prolyl cis-trans isomerase [Endozoicomonadaceae bacterium GTF-13]
MIVRLMRDPLLHFLLLGALVFAGYQWIKPANSRLDANTIVVDRNALLTFIQYRSKAFEPQLAERRLDALTPGDREALVRDFIKEEALYREARALGMIDNDYIVRRRSVQKLEFIAQGLAANAVEVEPRALADFFESRHQDYYEAPSLTFTHVYFNADKRGREAARTAAVALLAELNREGVAFADAPRYGDRYLYHRNYVERTPDFIASHFGAGFGQRLDTLSPGPRWQGPIASDQGEHLVLIREHQAGRLPALEEIRPRVEQDYRQWQQQTQQALAIQKIVDQYHVENQL